MQNAECRISELRCDYKILTNMICRGWRPRQPVVGLQIHLFRVVEDADPYELFSPINYNLSGNYSRLFTTKKAEKNLRLNFIVYNLQGSP